MEFKKDIVSSFDCGSWVCNELSAKILTEGNSVHDIKEVTIDSVLEVMKVVSNTLKSISRNSEETLYLFERIVRQVRVFLEGSLGSNHWEGPRFPSLEKFENQEAENK